MTNKTFIHRLHSGMVFDRRVKQLTLALASCMPNGVGVLDVGCGNGQIDKQLLQSRGDLTIEGVDVLVRDNTAIPVTHFDGKSLPYTDNSKDVVMFVDVLHHTEDPEASLREALRVTKRWILIKDHNRDGIAAETTLRVMDWFGNAHHGVVLPYNYLSRQEWSAIYSRLQLTVHKELQDLRLYPWWANWLFGRNLHSVVLLEKRTGTSSL